MIKTKKSINFDKNLDTARQKRQMEKNLYRVSEDIKATSKKFVPIGKRTTINSLRTKKVSPLNFVHETVNWTNSKWDRYNYKNSSVEKNRNKYQWFNRAFLSKKKKYEKEITQDVYKK